MPAHPGCRWHLCRRAAAEIPGTHRTPRIARIRTGGFAGYGAMAVAAMPAPRIDHACRRGADRGGTG
jgi:hypothetical protein